MGNKVSAATPTCAHVLPFGEDKQLPKIQNLLAVLENIGMISGNYTIGRIQVDHTSKTYNWCVFFKTRDEMQLFAESAVKLYTKTKSDISAAEVYDVLRDIGIDRIEAAAVATGKSVEGIQLRLRRGQLSAK